VQFGAVHEGVVLVAEGHLQKALLQHRDDVFNRDSVDPHLLLVLALRGLYLL